MSHIQAESDRRRFLERELAILPVGEHCQSVEEQRKRWTDEIKAIKTLEKTVTRERLKQEILMYETLELAVARVLRFKYPALALPLPLITAMAESLSTELLARY